MLTALLRVTSCVLVVLPIVKPLTVLANDRFPKVCAPPKLLPVGCTMTVPLVLRVALEEMLFRSLAHVMLLVDVGTALPVRKPNVEGWCNINPRVAAVRPIAPLELKTAE